MQETQLQQKEILAEKKENISKKSMHKKIRLISFISILGIFLLIVGFYVGSKYSLRDSSDPVKLSFENIGKLATQSAHETMINEINDSRKFLGTNIQIPFTQNKYIYTYNVAVDAGYDFRKIKAPKYVGEKIIIELPKAEILKAEVDHSSLKVYEEDKNCFTPLTLDKINAQEKKMQENAKQNAIDNGIYDLAYANAKKVITNFVHSFKEYKDCNIEVREAN